MSDAVPPPSLSRLIFRFEGFEFFRNLAENRVSGAFKGEYSIVEYRNLITTIKMISRSK